MPNRPVQIRDIDSDLWHKVKIDALTNEQTITEWVTEAIKAKLNIK